MPLEATPPRSALDGGSGAPIRIRSGAMRIFRSMAKSAAISSRPAGNSFLLKT